jgi:uncharacterized protein
MTHTINWFELPATNLERASRFYEAVLGASFKREHVEGSGLEMAVFDGAEESVRGAIVVDPRRQPASNGALVYLHVRDLDESLASIDRAGGSLVMSKTSIGENGSIALVKDTEGNIVGLHAPA